MNVDALMKDISERIVNHSVLPWLSDYTEFGHHHADGTPEGAPSLQEIGKWSIVIVIFRWEGTTMDQTTDRLSGDPYYAVVRYDWIGLTETAPEMVNTIEELDAWAIQSLKYVRENTDVGAWGRHEGSYIEDFKPDGTVIIRDQTGKYEDIDPAETGELRTIHL